MSKMIQPAEINQDALDAGFLAVFGVPRPKWTEYEWTRRAFQRGVEAYLAAVSQEKSSRPADPNKWAIAGLVRDQEEYYEAWRQSRRGAIASPLPTVSEEKER